MDLIFSSSDILTRGRGLTFDDVLLMPQHSTITSRRSPQLKTHITKNFQLDVPVISANMDTITEKEMAKTMALLGGMGILHRFMTIEEQVNQILEVKTFYKEKNLKTPLAASIGVKEEAQERAQKLVKAGVQILTIDIAHGDSILMIDTLKFIKKEFPHVDVIAGNTATPHGVRMMIDHGADAVKVGIGPGSMCTTRIITGCGVPQLTAIALCYQEAKKSHIPIIADGGLRTSGDVVKALAAGASSVMLGGMLAGSLETPGEINKGMKKYRGMASKDAQVSWRGELPEGMAAEGEAKMIPCKGSVVNVIQEILGGLRSGMSYLNAENLEEIQKKAFFMEISVQGIKESLPHGL